MLKKHIVKFLLLSLSLSLTSCTTKDDKKMAKKECPYGMWESSITTNLITEGRKAYQNILIDGNDIYWTEMRPSEKGRYVIVRYLGDGKFEDAIPAGYNARTRVHEYGGEAFAIHQGTIYFVNYDDQRIYVMKKGGSPIPLTAPGTRFANLVFTKSGLIAVAEKHDPNDPDNYRKVDNYLALINPETGAESTIASGFDFYSSPTVNKEENQLAWLSWNHPNLPWDSTELWVADFQNGKAENSRKVAGGGNESLFQPQWSNDNTLYYVSDKTGWWNLYRLKDQKEENIYPIEAEFGVPQWLFGASTWGFVNGHILSAFNENGSWSLGVLDPETKQMKKIDLKGIDYTQIRTGADFAAFIEGSVTDTRHIVRLNLKDFSTTTIATNTKVDIDPEDISLPRPIIFPSEGRQIYAYYYPPQNKQCQGPANELPPLIVNAHGGPTSATSATFALQVQYWTNRGFAYLDVNYGGSTGYGREYRELLKGNWGIVDVKDCENGAKYLVDQGMVDPKRLAIRGASAGGYITLCAMTFGKTFNVGASYFGMSDMIAMLKDTHKMEAHYSDLMLALPEEEEILRSRSPLFFADQVCCPIIFFQGDEDRIVPLNQTEMMYEAIKKRGIETELVVYPGEQHGFRQAKNIEDSLKKELAFYLKVLYKQ